MAVDLPTILERLEGVTGPSRELDALVTCALDYDPSMDHPESGKYLMVPSHHDECAAGTYWLQTRSGASLRTSEKLTASIDAAMAFVEERHKDNPMTHAVSILDVAIGAARDRYLELVGNRVDDVSFRKCLAIAVIAEEIRWEIEKQKRDEESQ